MKKSLVIAGIISAVVILICTVVLTIKSNDYDYPYRIHRENVELMYHDARADFVSNIDSIIRVIAPSTCMNGLAILQACEEYDVDIFFVLSQAQIESHFGTKGLAARTNSVFNVFAYDGLSFNNVNKKGKYDHPDLSIKPYLRLLTERYLVDGKTEKDLMHEYVDRSGNRYASNKDYEDSLLTTYQKYIEDEPLINAYKRYNKYRILSCK